MTLDLGAPVSAFFGHIVQLTRYKRSRCKKLFLFLVQRSEMKDFNLTSLAKSDGVDQFHALVAAKKTRERAKEKEQ